MKFTVHSAALAETIAAATSSLPSKPTVPILQGVLVQASIGTVTFSSFNYERSTSRVVQADVAETDTAVVAGRLLGVVGGQLPKNVECAVSVAGSEMVIVAGRTEYRLPLLVVEDYPQLPDVSSSPAYGSVDCEAFLDGVTAVGGFADGGIAGKENLAALNVTCEPDHLVLRATDSYAAARRRVPWTWTGQDEEVINVPAADLLATVRAIAAVGVEQVDLVWDGAVLGLRTRTTTVTMRVLAEEFPSRFDQATAAEELSAAATVKLTDLAAMVRRAVTLADDQFALVDVSIGGDVLAVATSESRGGIADEIAALVHGCGRLRMSARRLGKALAAVDLDEVTLGLQAGKHVLSILPGGVQPAADGVVRPGVRPTVASLMGVRGPR